MSVERVTSSSGGSKDRKEKRFDLIPVYPLGELARLYGFGINKYPSEDGIDNWRHGYDYSLSYAAAMRHLTSWWDGEDFDEESGVCHLINVIWHMMAMTEWSQTHPEMDDRPKTKLARLGNNSEVSEIKVIEKEKDKKFPTNPPPFAI